MCLHKLEIHHNGMFSALSARLTAVASRARALSIGSSSPVSSAKSKNARARQIVVLRRSEEHTSELQSLMRISYAVFCLKKKKKKYNEPKNCSNTYAMRDKNQLP